MVQIILLIGLGSPHISKRPIEFWPYERLFKTADLALICTATAERDATEKDGLVVPKGMEEFLEGRVTTLRIERALTGQPPGKAVEVVHFRCRPAGLRLANGPLLVAFELRAGIEDRKGLDLTAAFGGQVQYLVFLKKRSDGRYEFVSGMIDPALSAIKLTTAEGVNSLPRGGEGR